MTNKIYKTGYKVTCRFNNRNNARHGSLNMQSLYEHYQRLTSRLPNKVRWFAYVLAPLGISMTVLTAGLITVTAGLIITAGIENITANGYISTSLTWLLIIAFLAESVGYIVKERQEFLLTVVVRQLTYRRFRSVFTKSFSVPSTREQVLTYPGQISQFAYIVDTVISAVQIAAFLVICFVMYGIAGVFSVLFISGLVFISVKLIARIGKLWEKYIALEGERRLWIQKTVNALPRGRFIPSWSFALNTIIKIRNNEEKLLRKRVLLQVLNGFIDRSALTVILALVAIFGALIVPDTSFGIGIILATRYLYAAVQNILVNYRVIRLAIPMMHKLDELETSQKLEVIKNDLPKAPAQKIEIIAYSSQRAAALRKTVLMPNFAFVPQNPELSQAVVQAWKDSATSKEIAVFTSLMSQMGLQEAVITRFWQDVTTLSSGESHRAAVALILTEKPDWLILDDIFAALDPAIRELVATVILANVQTCTLMVRSEEYLPTVFAAKTSVKISDKAQPADTCKLNVSISEDDVKEQDLPDPLPQQATFRRAISLLFGKYVVWVGLGACIIAAAQVAFALTVAANSTLNSQVAYFAGLCALAAVIGTTMFFGALYYAPIARLSALHNRLIQRLEKFASPRTSGSVVGRVGEDFSDLQMSVSAAAGTVFFVIAQALMLICGAVVGAPIFIIVVLAVAPLALVAIRLGAKRILPATTAVANRRGDFLDIVGAHAGLKTAPVSPLLRRAGDTAYEKCEIDYLTATFRQANAYAFRSLLIQALIFILNISAVILVSLFGATNPIVAPAAVILFAVTLSSSMQSTVETLQEAGVLGLTTERVRLLEEFQNNHAYPQASDYILKQLEDALASGNELVAVIGSSGAGKSVLLDTLCRQAPSDKVSLIPTTDPFATEKTDASGLELAHSAIHNSSTRLILLDETLKNLTPQQERNELKSLAKMLKQTGKQAIVVLHSRTNLDCFSAVVNLDN